MAGLRKKRLVKRKAVYKKRISKKPKVSLAVRTFVKRTIHKTIENKCIQVNGGNSFGNVLESPDFNAYPMLPLSGFWNIPQGVTQGTRIGNQIKTRKCFLNYIIRPTPYDVTVNAFPYPSEVQLMLGYVKNTPCYVPAAIDINQLFQSGASVAAPVGSLRDVISVINTDYWVIKKRWTHKIGYSANTGTGGVAANQYGQNNDFKINAMKRLNITKLVPQTCQFNDAGLSPTSRNLFLMYYAVAANNGITGATTLPCNIEFWIDYHYEDA